MKRSVRFLVLILVLAVLVGGYVLISNNSKKAVEAVDESTGSFTLTTKLPEDAVSLHWEANGQTFDLKKGDDGWTRTDDTSWPLDQDAVQKLSDDLNGLTADRKLDDVTDLSVYGLAEPSFTVTAGYADGTELTYSMGDATPYADGYYLYVSDNDKTVYTVADSLADTFDTTMNLLAEEETIPTVEDVCGLQIGDLSLVKETASRTVNSDELWYNEATGTPLDTEDVESLVTTATGLSWASLVTAKADDMSAYGLDNPTKIILKGTDGTSVTLLIGSQDDSGNYYAALDGSAQVHTLASSDVETLTAASELTLWSREVLSEDMAGIREITLTTDYGTMTLNPGSDGEAIATSTDLDEGLWSQLQQLSGVSRVEDAVIMAPVLTMDVTSLAGVTQHMVFSLAEGDTTYYVLSREGRDDVRVAATTVDTIVRTLRQMTH